MPSYISKDGIWEPRNEKVALVDKNGEPYIYEGKDRAALEYMAEQGVDSLGIDFRKDPEVIMHARQLNMTVEEFCQTATFTDKMRNEAYLRAKGEVNLHRPLPRKPATKQRSGGANTAGGGSLEGGFADGKESAESAAIKAVQSQGNKK